MDTWLIFHDFLALRRSDEVLYVLRIIGFAFVLRESSPGKSGERPLVEISRRAKTLGATLGDETKRASEKSF